MKKCFRWLLLILTIGGGFMGLALTIQAIFQQGASDFISYFFYAVAVAFYSFTIVSGLLFAENPECLSPLRVAFCLQIPWVSSPIVAYGFSAGCRITAGLGLSDGRFSVTLHYGSDFELFILGRHPWFVGINVFAVLILVLLARYGQTPNTAAEQQGRTEGQTEIA